MIFIGDIHGKIEPLIDNILNFEFRDTNLIQVGDFGVGFNEYIEKSNLKILNDLLKATNINLYVVRGNHDDPEIWENQSYKFSNIIFLKDYSVTEIENQKVLIIGGGISIDRVNRTEGIDFWEDEIIQRNEKFLNNNSINCDILVTHVPLKKPNLAFGSPWLLQRFGKYDPNLENDLKIEQETLLEIENKIISMGTCKHWISGHMHKSGFYQEHSIDYRVLAINEFFEI